MKEKLETIREGRGRGRVVTRADKGRCKKWRRELHCHKALEWRGAIMDVEASSFPHS